MEELRINIELKYNQEVSIMLYPVLSNMNNWLDNDFDDMLDTSWMPRVNFTAPAINVKENDKNYEIELAAPGTTKDDFRVNVDKDGCLTIKLEHKDDKKDENKKEHYLRREFSYSNYEQALTLPDDVEKDKIEAKVDNGVLHVTLPRTPKAEKETKKIEVA
jgi:HSP20 family protein